MLNRKTTQLRSSIPKRYRPNKWGKRRKRARTHDGKIITLKLHKRIPKKCSTPRQLCLKCRRYIPKKDSPYYQQKICRKCATTEVSIVQLAEGNRLREAYLLTTLAPVARKKPKIKPARVARLTARQNKFRRAGLSYSAMMRIIEDAALVTYEKFFGLNKGKRGNRCANSSALTASSSTTRTGTRRCFDARAPSARNSQSRGTGRTTKTASNRYISRSTARRSHTTTAVGKRRGRSKHGR